MAHTAKSLEGAIYDLILGYNAIIGMTMIDPFQEEPIFNDVAAGPPPGGQCFARVRFDQTSFNKVNTLAAITHLQVVFFHIDVWSRVIAGTNDTDNAAAASYPGLIIPTMTVPEAANAGDWGWNNITNMQMLYASPVVYTKRPGVNKRTIYCAATWN